MPKRISPKRSVTKDQFRSGDEQRRQNSHDNSGSRQRHNIDSKQWKQQRHKHRQQQRRQVIQARLRHEDTLTDGQQPEEPT